MKLSRSPSRAIAVTAIMAVFASAFSVSGCKWFRKGDPYAMSAESRPLEVPPELDPQQTDTGTSTGSVMRSSMGGGNASAANAFGFVIAGARADVFAQVGDALAAIEGVTIANRAQALSVYDVDYQGSQFLIRVADAQGGSQVTAVDPRGVAAQGDAAVKLIAALKAALGGR